MKIEISHGELLDKLSILEIKLEKITDPEKLKNVQKEYLQLKPLATSILKNCPNQYSRLKSVNLQLWEIEDRIREFERLKIFDDPFIQTARMVYRHNDERAAIKKEINMLTGSGLIEEKSYRPY